MFNSTNAFFGVKPKVNIIFSLLDTLFLTLHINRKTEKMEADITKSDFFVVLFQENLI